jgi:AcrR family transcriptional regulator
MGTEKLDTELRQAQIAEAALNLVARHGMKGLSVAGVARHVGLVPSAIYRHFRSKDQILDAILDLLRDKLQGNVKAARKRAPAPLERLRWLLVLHVRLIREYQAIPRILFSEEVYGGNHARKTKLHRVFTSYLDEVAAIVRQGQKERLIRPELHPGTVALMFIGLFQPSAVLWHLSEGTFDVTKHAERAWKLFSEAIRVKGIKAINSQQSAISNRQSTTRNPQ